MEYLFEKNGALFFKRRQEIMEISAWGQGLRVRATENTRFSGKDWALSPEDKREALIEIGEKKGIISNGNIRAEVTPYGKICFYNQKGELLLKEYYRSWEHGIENWEDLDQIVMLRIPAREYHNAGGDSYRIQVRFEAEDEERIYGMGQYQHPYLNLKGCRLEMAPRNTQISVPFAVSSRGYGLLWNNPAVGTADFGRNITEFTAESARQIDYWITAADTPAGIVENYADVTGKVPMMPDYAMGFWQCRLRYTDQEEVLRVAREYDRRKLPLKVIVIDFFHWPHQGDWRFDPEYWPDPKRMAEELHEMGIRLMVSVWPTVEHGSENSGEMAEKGLLIRANSGMDYILGNARVFDATNPEAREYVWNKCKKNYFDYGIDLFWLDEAEPGYQRPEFGAYRLYDGNAAECGNEFAKCYAQGFFEGMKQEGVENPLNLIRCAWAGSQKYGALVWSGDVPSTFTYLNYQVRAGLNMGLAGIPWWTADIGGFHGGNGEDPRFRELLLRWFQYGTFCPVMRLHGDRSPRKEPIGARGGGAWPSGADNEIWSYGPEAEEMMTRYIKIRERLKPYIREMMQEAHEKGTPAVKPLFYDFPEDPRAWEEETSYLFGHDLLVSPVTEEKATEKSVYLPAGAMWTEVYTGRVYEGGQRIAAEAPLTEIPLFVKNNGEVLNLLKDRNGRISG